MIESDRACSACCLQLHNSLQMSPISKRRRGSVWCCPLALGLFGRRQRCLFDLTLAFSRAQSSLSWRQIPEQLLRSPCRPPTSLPLPLPLHPTRPPHNLPHSSACRASRAQNGQAGPGSPSPSLAVMCSCCGARAGLGESSFAPALSSKH